MAVIDLTLQDGRSLRVHDDESGDPVVLWHHGSPQTGRLLEPLLIAARARGIRLLSYARPSYEGSSALPGRSVASAAADVLQVIDRLGIDRLATMGASGGGPHALACAALLPSRVTAVVCMAGIAPQTEEFDWFEGMAAPGGLRSAFAGGRRARAEFAQTDEFDPSQFVDADYAALEHDWASLGEDAGRAGALDPDGLIDDDVAFTSPWGFELDEIATPVLLVQGRLDRVVPPSHAVWMRSQIRGSQLRSIPDAGHISVLAACADAMDWISVRS